MYLSILLLPLISSFISPNRTCGVKGSPMLSTFVMFITTILVGFVFFEVGFSGAPVELNLGAWIDNGHILVDWSFIFDSLAVSMFLPIAFITFLVQLYSMEYMGSDPHVSRFFSLLSIFSFSMLIMVTGNNLIMILLGWEMVGIISYLLVNFWFTRIAANMASMQALFLNKIGDWFFILGIILAISLFGDLSLATLFSLASELNNNLVFLFTLGILGAAVAKSALIGLHPWLPNAMEGPTPVSS